VDCDDRHHGLGGLLGHGVPPCLILTCEQIIDSKGLAFQLLSVVESQQMKLPDLDLLTEIGLSRDERSALVALMSLGISDAATLCREGEIASSKIYRAMEKLAALGLVQIQPTRPKQYAALPADVVVDRMVDLARERAERFARGTQELRRTLAALPERLRGRQTFVDLALGLESHVRRHLAHLATATGRILSYMERGDLAAIDQA